MPWVKNINGEDAYKPSRYAKEELPTWNEVYNDWYKNDLFIYNMNFDQTLDVYWKIPRIKYLLAVICNQFNKMIFEDKSFSTKMISKARIKELIGIGSDIEEICDIRFILSPLDRSYFSMIENLKTGKYNIDPPIYTFPNPSGKENPFIDTYNRIDIKNVDNMELTILLSIRYDNKIFFISSTAVPGIRDYIISEIIKPYKEYFENGIGWKDENGNMIEKINQKYNRAADAAL